MKRVLPLAVLLFLAVPAAFAAPPAGHGNQGQGGQSAAPSVSELCKQQRQSMGMNAFRSLYAPNGSPSDAFAACLASQTAQASTNAKNAANECKAERADAGFSGAHSGKSFSEFYGTNANKKNAFGKCVSMKAKEASADQQEATLNAAKKCKAERADAGFSAAHSGKSFSEFYGTNANKKNAFGKCVSKNAKPATS